MLKLTNPMRQNEALNEVLRGNDWGDVFDQIWANAALPRVTGLVGKPEPEVVSALTGDHPISQIKREAVQPNKRAATNQ